MLQTTGEPLELDTYTGLNGRSGFVMAPFHIGDETPLLLLQPNRVETYPAGDDGVQQAICRCLHPAGNHHRRGCIAECLPEAGWEAYAEDFVKYHSRLVSGEFHKIVLARCAQERGVPSEEPVAMFCKACELYPRMFVALYSTPRSGTWLMATPEILLEGGGSRWNTIALAGTMKLEGTALEHFDMPMKSHAGCPEQGMRLAWDEKNLEEQRYVSAYIRKCLERFSPEVAEEGPYTVRAGNLVHLRSDFNFVLKEENCIGELISALHPTPAVCGLPKKETFDFILDNEHTPRAYYSGFAGLLNVEGRTNLYVSLRCMEICRDGYDLYAGGGLLEDSVEQQEWEETEAKMETMRRILNDDVYQ